MRRFFSFALVGLLALAASGRAGCPLGGCCPGCKPIPAPDCPDCGCPCDHRMHLACFNDACEYIDALHSGGTCCDRIKAAEKLGSRLHADFCCDPAVLDALLGALSCDSCWEVRYAAAWSIFKQDARTEPAVLALYVSSKMDPHYMVRTRAAEALDILTVCRKECYVELLKHADDLIKELKKQGYKPGTANCNLLYGAACAGAGLPLAQPAVAPIAPTAPPMPKAGAPAVLQTAHPLPAGAATN